MSNKPTPLIEEIPTEPDPLSGQPNVLTSLDGRFSPSVKDLNEEPFEVIGTTNVLVRASDWKIGLSKTGYISEAGKCLVMQAIIANQPVVIVLLDSWGRLTRIGDANRIRRWLESNPGKLGNSPLHSG